MIRLQNFEDVVGLNHDVVGFYVAVNHTLRMGVYQRITELSKPVFDLLPTEMILGMQSLRQ